MYNGKILDDCLKCAPTYFVQIISQLFSFFLNINAQPDQCRLLHAQSLMGGVTDIAVVLKESQNQENIILVVCSLNHFT